MSSTSTGGVGLRARSHIAQCLSLFRRELAAYFFSPMSYVVWSVFLIIAGYLFATTLRDGQIASMAPSFHHMSLLLIFVTPLITMHLIAEETRLGTLEVLLSDPASEASIIIGKFLAAYVFVLIVISPTIAYPIVLSVSGQPDPGPIAAGYLGLVLLAGLFTAVGLLSSTLLSSQFAAAALSFTVLILFWGLELAARSVGPGVLRSLFSYVSAFNHFTAFLRGVVDTRAVVYYTGLTSVSLFMAVRLLLIRRLA